MRNAFLMVNAGVFRIIKVIHMKVAVQNVVPMPIVVVIALAYAVNALIHAQARVAKVLCAKLPTIFQFVHVQLNIQAIHLQAVARRNYPLHRLIPVIHRRAVLTPNAETLTSMRSVPVYQVSSVHRRSVGPNVLSVQNVHRSKHALIKNVLIHVAEPAVLMLDVKYLTIAQFAAAKLGKPGILLRVVNQYHYHHHHRRN